MKITAIKAQVKNQGRVSIYIDDTYSFSLNQSQLLEAKVYVGKQLDDNQLTSLKYNSDFGKAYARALEYVYRRPRSLKEINDYVWRKQWPQQVGEQVVAKLQEKGYINDDRFAAAWVRHRALGKPTSSRKLRLELKQKGVAENTITRALADDEAFDERTALQTLITKKRSRYTDEQKLTAYLMRHGFRYDDVKEALDNS